MKTKILKSEEEYNEACDRVYKLIHSSVDPIDRDSPAGEEIEILSLVIEKYEHENYPIEPPNPIEAIKFRMDQMNIKQVDIAPLFGGSTRVSEVLGGKRPLTLKMITLLNRFLGIPFESLIIGNREITLEPEKQERLLKVPSIYAYFSKGGIAAV